MIVKDVETEQENAWLKVKPILELYQMVKFASHTSNATGMICGHAWLFACHKILKYTAIFCAIYILLQLSCRN